jgi:hypothetical protein
MRVKTKSIRKIKQPLKTPPSSALPSTFSREAGEGKHQTLIFIIQ